MTMHRFRSFAGLALGVLCTGCVAPPPPLLVQNCREFAQTVTVDGKSQTGYGVECPQADGTWQVVAPPVVPPPGTPAPSTTGATVPYYAVPYPYYSYYPGYYSYYPAYYPWYYLPTLQFGFGWYGGGYRGGYGHWGGYGHGGGRWHH
jgi:hypothetical protein